MNVFALKKYKHSSNGYHKRSQCFLSHIASDCSCTLHDALVVAVIAVVVVVADMALITK